MIEIAQESAMTATVEPDESETARALRRVGISDAGEYVLRLDYHGQLEASVSSQDYWLQRVEYSDDARRLDRVFQAWRGKQHERDRGDTRAFLAWLGARVPGLEITGLYGDGRPMCGATVNADSPLMTDFHWTYLETAIDGSAYVILGAGDYFTPSRLKVFQSNGCGVCGQIGCAHDGYDRDADGDE